MKNPWLDIPLSDYEGHMAMPHIAQAQLLSDVFAGALKEFSPYSVAVLGCSGGNGFERISPEITKRVVGIDINPEYIQVARRRYKERIPVLELFVGDIQSEDFDFSPVDIVFAGLLFEYVDVDVVLGKIRSRLKANGRLVSVVQLPSDEIPEVSPSPFTSLRALVVHLVPPKELERLAVAHGYKQADSRVVESIGGKQFQVQVFFLVAPDKDTQPKG